ncbi:MAG: imidazoleglycerol-phosphate dehydratase [Desulfobacteraceae bacterium Eth-SRB2]|nr:MAG: imidazoleglycerol-phosphate dehydratase [Desulfobacteraceae bacterium Eth-SRB2]
MQIKAQKVKIQARNNKIMERTAKIERETKETRIRMELNLDGSGKDNISTGIPFFDHMLTLFTVHGFFDLSIDATGDIDVDYHHTIEDVGLVLGDAFDKALGDRKGIKRFGHAVTPMDDALSSVAADLSKRPFLVYNVPQKANAGGDNFTSLTKEFLRAFSNRGGMNLHVNVLYGENEHHILESIFKTMARALDQAASFDSRLKGIRSSKGVL